MTRLQGPDPELLYGRQDAADPRLGELVRTGTTDKTSNVEIFGWPDDEGIRLNGGRPGAAEAPDRIRRFLYRMTPPLDSDRTPSLHDRGNLELASSLADRHGAARVVVADAYRRDRAVLTLGGGHDYGFPDAAAFLDVFAANATRPAVINFDAHLDVRSTASGFHSGTPFRRLLEEFGGRFDFLEIGLQPQCNSRAHRDWAEAQGAELWMADDVRTREALQSRLMSWIGPRAGAPLFMSLDIDAISSASAPGCSQSWDRGLSSDRIFEALAILDGKMAWKGLGIYEVSPPLDHDDRTSKLAALFAFEFLRRKS